MSAERVRKRMAEVCADYGISARTERTRKFRAEPPRRLTARVFDQKVGKYIDVTDPREIAEIHNSVSIPPWARRLLNTARKRAASLDMPYALTAIDMSKLIRKADGRCAVTGIPFDLTKSEEHYHRPFAPSLDRIRNERGYIPANIRLVCVAVNIAMKQWGEDILLQIARALVAKADKT